MTEDFAKEIKQEILNLINSDPELKLKLSPNQLEAAKPFLTKKLFSVINVSKNLKNYELLKSFILGYYTRLKKFTLDLAELIDSKDFVDKDEFLAHLLRFLEEHKL